VAELKPDLRNISLDTWDHRIFRKRELLVDILRLDKIHPEISGNKWFKLKYYLEKAVRSGKHTLVSFGGAYSNHLLALAAAARMYGLKSIGFVRGEEPMQLSNILIAAKTYGMKLIFLSRTEYDLKKKSGFTNYGTENFNHVKSVNDTDSLFIPEGGAGIEGILGAEEILSIVPDQQYSHVCAAVGTGTTLTGLINSAEPNLKIIGISVLKGTRDLEPLDISWIKEKDKLSSVQMIHNYHFGGYAKYNALLTGFMNTTYAETGIPSDFVYTGKLLFAVISMADMKLFPSGSRILVLHTGGLQGNRSLTPGLLGF
jgi:1-aminocyclopropane-1-carboxylate deaminase